MRFFIILGRDGSFDLVSIKQFKSSQMEIFSERARRRREREEDATSETEDPEEVTTFSFETMVDEKGEDAAKDIFGFPSDEIRELAQVVHCCLVNKGRGRKGMLPLDKLAVTLCWATSGLPFAKLAAHLGLSRSFV